MKITPKVTAITVVYNDAQGIQKTIDSILSQSHPVDEYIIIDGNSTDGTKDIIEIYKDSLAHFCSEPDNGIYDAMNKGWKKSSPGNYIIYCNSSDYLEKDAIKNFIEAFKVNNERVDIFHGLLKFVKNNKLLYIQGRSSVYLDKKMIEHPACFVNKTVFEELNGFNNSYRSAADYDFMLRAKSKKFRFLFFPEIISNFDVTGISSTSVVGPLESLKIRAQHKLISKKEYILRMLSVKLTKTAKSIIK